MQNEGLTKTNFFFFHSMQISLYLLQILLSKILQFNANILSTSSITSSMQTIVIFINAEYCSLHQYRISSTSSMQNFVKVVEHCPKPFFVFFLIQCKYLCTSSIALWQGCQTKTNSCFFFLFQCKYLCTYSIALLARLSYQNQFLFFIKYLCTYSNSIHSIVI